MKKRLARVSFYALVDENEVINDEINIPMCYQYHVSYSDPFEMTEEYGDTNIDLAKLEMHFSKDKDFEEFDRPLPGFGEVYRHFKIGKEVMVIGIARHTETAEELAIYKSLDNKKLFVRPLAMFMSEVDRNKYPDAKQKYRFESTGKNLVADRVAELKEAVVIQHS